ncbi:secretory lipase [Fusarium heterosporum]|uniref:Secretory lipase n=1 Tax=Fusarium heterosporum TaxID=42747 RepID=A0A8H5SRH0_FUSHE|nr:secretory lipase [Fusarium heterosporum]
MLFKVLITTLLPGALAINANDPNQCDVKCQNVYRQALVGEASQWVNQNVTTDDFYSNPTNLSSYSAGDLVKWDEVPSDQISKRWTLPAGVSMTRFFYMSEDIDGKPIPATGFVLTPYTNPLGEDKPFRTLVWTHGTAGGTRQCAPSNHRVLYYEWQGPLALVQQGYVVIAPDYAGQGSDIPQGFMYESGALHAGDVSFGLKAVRTVLGDRITKEWVVVGHSEGGLTAWRTCEREAKPGKATGGFLGAVSLAPALQPIKLIPESFRRAKGGPVGDVVSIYLLQSFARLFPSIKVEDYVSDIVLSRIPLADQGCLSTGGAIYGSLTEKELYKNTSWLQHPDFLDWQKRFNGAGPHALAAPMLVAQGDADILTYAKYAEEDFDATCKDFPESIAEYKLYPDLDHDSLAEASKAGYLPWIADRFNNVTLPKGCKKTVVSPATKKFGIISQTWISSSPR